MRNLFTACTAQYSIQDLETFKCTPETICWLVLVVFVMSITFDKLQVIAPFSTSPPSPLSLCPDLTTKLISSARARLVPRNRLSLIMFPLALPRPGCQHRGSLQRSGHRVLLHPPAPAQARLQRDRAPPTLQHLRGGGLLDSSHVQSRGHLRRSDLRLPR